MSTREAVVKPIRAAAARRVVDRCRPARKHAVDDVAAPEVEHGIGEVSVAALATWFKADACGVGIGGELIQSHHVAAGDFAAIGSRVAEVRDMVRQARGGTKSP